MCWVNDKKRSDYDEQIGVLNDEYKNEEEKLADIKKAKGEIQQAVNMCDCVKDNMAKCDFGGDKILSSITTSQLGYKNKENFYDEYKLKCEEAMEQIEAEKLEIKALRDSLPKNCGDCDECNPKPQRVYIAKDKLP